MHPKTVLQKQTGTSKVDPQLYRAVVGSLIYMTNTRPDICHVVSIVSRYMDSPELAHFQAAKQILRYLKGTINYGLLFSSEEDPHLHTFADANWGRDLDTRRSTSGILHKIGNSSISWTSKLQPVVSLSTAEAEYIVLSDATKDIIHLRRLLSELGEKISGPTQLLSDNQSCIKLVRNRVQYSKTKHIDIRFHFIREKSQEGEVHVTYIPTTYQQANFSTKPLPYPSFVANRFNTRVRILPSCDYHVAL
jgi:hypothetical protein